VSRDATRKNTNTDDGTHLVCDGFSPEAKTRIPFTVLFCIWLFWELFWLL
jgi:hypothetical protein